MKTSDLIISLKEGITHIEDLSHKEFLQAIKNLNSFEITEKIDGANLWFGIDENGFYTSREGKGKKARYRSEDDWGDKFSDTGFRSAHQALEKIFTTVTNSRPHQLMFERHVDYAVEILFGKMPNAIPYNGEINQIIILGKVGHATREDRLQVEQLIDSVKEKIVKVKVLSVPYTEDGITIKRRDEEHEWVVNVVPEVPKNQIKREQAQGKIDFEVSKIEEILKRKIKVGSKTHKAEDILGIPLNKKPDWLGSDDWPEIKNILKPIQDDLRKEILDSKLEIKEALLDSFVRGMQSHFGPKEGSWIEGVVLRDADDNKIKIVDRNGFTAINKFNWLVRSDIVSTPNKDSVIQRLKLEMSKELGHSQLSSSNVQRYLKNFGENQGEIVSNLSADVSFRSCKKEWLKLTKKGNRELAVLRKHFFERTGPYVEIDYAEEIVDRTLQSFAQAQELIDTYNAAILSSKNAEDLVVIMIADKLKP